MAFGNAPRRGEDVRIDRVTAAIGPAIEGLGYDLVRVQMQSGRQPVLQIMAERRDGRGMTVEDCAAISRDVSAILDVADPIVGAYSLEVSSPGIDRPLVREADYVRFAGFEARVEVEQPIDGRKRFQGRIAGVEDGHVVLQTPTESWRVPLDRVHRAKLVLTDDLLKAAARASEAAHADQ